MFKMQLLQAVQLLDLTYVLDFQTGFYLLTFKLLDGF